MSAEPSRLYEILVVEDNPGDARLLQEALREGTIRNQMNVLEDGEEALQYLHQLGKFSKAPRPDLIFLDLNLPRKDGRELLAEIKSNTKLKQIPIVVLSTSDAEHDVIRAYNLHANCYLRKPVDLEAFFHTVKACQSYWLGLVRLPSGRDSDRLQSAGNKINHSNGI
jgi:CheY-like chemotaxis protein